MDVKRLSVVVPYRNREEHLQKFLPHMREYLTESRIPFHIYVVHQADQKPFNRAKLLNIGFKESDSFDYHVFHDIDMLPLDSDYGFVTEPTHLATEVEQFGWKLPYEEFFGGVCVFDRDSFVKINGFSNEYWGWGGEDDDLLKRCSIAGLNPQRKDCRYVSLIHKPSSLDNYQSNLERLREFRRNPSLARIMSDGLSNLTYVKRSETSLGDDATMLNVEI